MYGILRSGKATDDLVPGNGARSTSSSGVLESHSSGERRRSASGGDRRGRAALGGKEEGDDAANASDEFYFIFPFCFIIIFFPFGCISPASYLPVYIYCKVEIILWRVGFVLGHWVVFGTR